MRLIIDEILWAMYGFAMYFMGYGVCHLYEKWLREHDREG